MPAQTFEEARADLKEDYDDPKYTYFVAEHDGKVMGAAIGCNIEISSGHQGPNRVAGAAFLGFAAVFPDARGLGAGKAVGEARSPGRATPASNSIKTDWRSANLEADRTWRRLGFRLTFRRMHRSII